MCYILKGAPSSSEDPIPVEFTSGLEGPIPALDPVSELVLISYDNPMSDESTSQELVTASLLIPAPPYPVLQMPDTVLEMILEHLGWRDLARLMIASNAARIVVVRFLEWRIVELVRGTGVGNRGRLRVTLESHTIGPRSPHRLDASHFSIDPTLRLASFRCFFHPEGNQTELAYIRGRPEHHLRLTLARRFPGDNAGAEVAHTVGWAALVGFDNVAEMWAEGGWRIGGIGRVYLSDGFGRVQAEAVFEATEVRRDPRYQGPQGVWIEFAAVVMGVGSVLKWLEMLRF